MDGLKQFKEDLANNKIDVERLIDLLAKSQQALQQVRKELAEAKQRIKELEKQLGVSPTTKLDEPFSVREEEKRQEKRGKKTNKNTKRTKKKPRLTSTDKLKLAVRTERIYPANAARKTCRLSHTRPVWRLENGQAVVVAYEIYRGPKNVYGKIPGVLGRSEFGIEILITIAYLVFVVGLSFDKVCALLNFFQNLKLRKSQVDALLNQLSRHWESEFENLCSLLANSAVVHTDETSWSLHSVWAFLSEKVRLFFFGVNKDSKTLQQILDPATFNGIVVSDDAAVYANFNQSQKCWAHLLRKAIKLTLLEPANKEYRKFTDRLLEIYRKACRLQCDQRFSAEGRKQRVADLDDEILELCGDLWSKELPPSEGPENDYRLLINEVMRLMLEQQLFTFVTASPVQQADGTSTAVAGTNNEAERSLRNAANDRKIGRTSKTLRGAKRRTIIQSMLESLRVQLPNFTLSAVVNEIKRWCHEGKSCFAKLLQQQQIPPPVKSILSSIPSFKN